MAFTLNIAGEPREIKLNYGLVFRLNQELATKDEKTGESQDNGVGLLFAQIVEKDDKALFRFLQVACKGKTKLDEKTYIETIERYAEDFDDEEEAMEHLFAEVKAEMVRSGFFKRKVKQFTENMSKAIQHLEHSKKEDEREQARLIKQTAEQIKKEISSDIAHA